MGKSNVVDLPTKNEAKLSTTEKRILALVVAEPGITHKEIARRLNYSRSYVSSIIVAEPLHSEIDRVMDEIIDDAKRRMTADLVEAARMLSTIAKDKSAKNSDRIHAGKTMFNLVGGRRS